MNVEPKDILVVLSIISILAGAILWVLGRVLTDKKDKMTLTFEIERLKEIVGNIKGETEKIELIQRELDVIKEQIKHL
jgi:hypothetical protein